MHFIPSKDCPSILLTIVMYNAIASIMNGQSVNIFPVKYLNLGTVKISHIKISCYTVYQVYVFHSVIYKQSYVAGTPD